MTLPRRLAACAFALLALQGTRAAGVRVETSAAWVENISHASGPSDWRDASRFNVRGSLGGFRQWTAGLITSGEVTGSFEHVPKYSKLDALTGGLSGQARQKFGLGPFAPVISLDAGFLGRDARLDGDDGWTATSALRATKRLAQSWRFAAVGDWQQHYARNSIFDTRHRRVFGTLTWNVTPKLQLSHGNGRLWGDFTANASPGVWSRALSGAAGANISQYYNTVSWSALDVFGPGWVTYRVRGHVNFWWLELSPALGPNTSLPLRYESLFSVNKVGVKYRQDVWSLQLLHRF
jgi:hypothetical protein